MSFTDADVDRKVTGLKKLRLGKPTGLEFRPSYKGPVRLDQCPDCASGYRRRPRTVVHADLELMRWTG
jgi:hypothetical protein